MQLVDSGPGRLALWGVVTVAIVSALTALGRSYRRSRRKKRTVSYAALETLSDEVDDVLDVLARRHLSDFRESVTIRFWIGDNADGDRVSETRTTTPTPYVSYRLTGPFVGADGRADDLRASHDDGRCQVDVRDIVVRNRHRVLTSFEPGMAEPFVWTLDYVARGLWNPVRESGEDSVNLYLGSLTQPRDFSIERLTVHFLLPWGVSRVRLTEDLDRGETRYRMTKDGEVEIVWTTAEPDQRFGWTVTVGQWRRRT